MGLLSHSFISFLVLLGATPLATSRSLKHTFIPRQASPGFAGCTYPAGWESCNSKDNRNCWLKDPSGKEYNTDTDYEDDFPQGIERTYDLEIQEANISPDGVTKLAQTINGKYPGELIEACWGDTLIINVKNTLPTNGTTIHWHGLRMFQENQMDGVNGVTQCPISEGDTFTYKFHLRQYGHTWYHSHYSSQYTDGVAAPLLIHGPNTDDWDEEWSPIIVTDWYHENAYKAAHAALSRPPPADSILVNGTGRNNPAGTGDYFRQTFEHDKRYLIRLINGGTDFHFHFSIDNHMLEVVSADLVPIKPFYTNSLSIGIGQRYSVIVHANQTAATNGQYWMRTEYVSNGNTCQFDQPNFPVAEPDTQRVGIISYSNSTGGDPTTSRWPATVTCDDTSFEPRVKWQVTAPQNTGNVKAHDAGLDLTAKAHGFNRWTLAERPLWLNYSDPTMLNLDNKTWNPEYDIDPYTQNDPEGFVYMVINSGNGTNSLISAAHPIHLHGHDFAILSQGDGLVDPDNLPTLNVNNPPRRDVAMLPNKGHLILAFKPDNPGIWIMHCHIAWHAGSGLALQVLERQSEIAKTVGSSAIDNVKQGCKKWTDWMAMHPQDFSYDMQEDSGI